MLHSLRKDALKAPWDDATPLPAPMDLVKPERLTELQELFDHRHRRMLALVAASPHPVCFLRDQGPWTDPEWTLNVARLCATLAVFPGRAPKCLLYFSNAVPDDLDLRHTRTHAALPDTAGVAVFLCNAPLEDYDAPPDAPQTAAFRAVLDALEAAVLHADRAP